MARYRGRHRKPTHTGRNLAAISTSGAFLAAGLTATVTEASAAPDGDWDRLAQCESGGDWSINTGNPFSGGLQFLPSTWNAFRVNVPGTPSQAHHASREQQIAVAEFVLDTQGWNAWPACSDKLGLSSGAEPGARSVQSQPAPQPRRVEPAPASQQRQQADPPNLGQRNADGSGQYRCASDSLHFEACDPHNVGEIVEFPLFTHAESAQPGPVAAPAPVSTGKHAKPDPEPQVGKPAVTGQATAPAGGNTVTDAAKQLLGVPYVWGGTSSSGVDCSGLVYNALQKAGHSPPRTAAAMQDWAAPISQGEAKAGDLFFWSPGGGTATHTGLYLGGDTVIEVSQPGTVVSIRSVYSGMTFGRIP